MTRYTAHLCGAAPNLSDPDYPPGCVETPADYARQGYNEWHEMARIRTARGERQRLCATCERWAWPSTPCGKLRATSSTYGRSILREAAREERES